MKKSLSKLGIKESYLDTIKAIVIKSIIGIILNRENKVFPIRLGLVK
jgi:hypothetical protein